MNPFESTLVSALRDEAQEIAMSTDLNEGREVLEHRLDVVDAATRRRRWITGLVAVAAVGAIVAVLVGVSRPTAAPVPPATSSPSPTAPRFAAFASSSFAFPFSMLTPDWVTEALDRPTSENARHVTWNRCEGDICTGLTFLSLSKLDPFALEQREDTAMPGYRGYLDYLDSLVADGKIAYGAQRTTTVGGRPATVLVVQPLTTVSDGVGCEAGDGTTDDCWDFFEGVTTRMAIVDVGSSNPLVILTRTPPDNADGEKWLAEFDPMLDTVQFDLSRINPMLGVWTATATRDEVASVLRANGLEAESARVLKELEPAGDPMTWQMWVDPTWYRVYAVKADGTTIKFDEHTYVRDGDRISGTTADGQGLVTVSTVTVDGTSLRWKVVSATESQQEGQLSEEAMQRAVYTAATWERQSS